MIATALLGAATLTLSPATATALHAKHVTLAAGAPLTVKGRAVTFPLDEAAAGAVIVEGRGKLTLRRAHRSVTLAAPQIVSGARVTAVLGGQRTTVFTLAGTRVTLAPTAARTIARRLRAKLPRALGTLNAAPVYAAAPGACRATTQGGAAPDPGTGEPPAKARPATALNVVSATVTWHVRDSFIQYIASGEGTSTANGATGEPPTGDARLVYGFHFAPTSGWCDPDTGAARLTFAGTVVFRYSDHGIDLKVNDPEVELDGPASRVAFGTPRRVVIETLDVSKATVTSDGKTLTYDHIPAAVPPGAADSVFAGYYLPGDPFGWVSISFTTA